MSDTQDRPEGAQRPWYSTTVSEFMADLDAMVAARYDARRQDRINERCDAAEHDPGTPEAWAQGCECERQDGRDGWDVAFGCPMHDPRGE